MADRINQVVLGVFVGNFAYCLVVLRTIRGGDEGAFGVTFGCLVGLLLAFSDRLLESTSFITFRSRSSIQRHRSRCPADARFDRQDYSPAVSPTDAGDPAAVGLGVTAKAWSACLQHNGLHRKRERGCALLPGRRNVTLSWPGTLPSASSSWRDAVGFGGEAAVHEDAWPSCCDLRDWQASHRSAGCPLWRAAESSI